MTQNEPVSLTYFFNSNYTHPKLNLTLLQVSHIYTYLDPRLADIKVAESLAHSHWFSEIFFITEGGGELLINGKTYPVMQGDFVLINPSISHVEINKHNLAYICLCLFPLRFQLPLENYVLHAQAQEKEFTALLNEFSLNKKDSENLIWLYFHEFFLKLKRLAPAIFNEQKSQAVSKEKSTKHYSAVIELALEYIEEHYSHDITLDDLAEATFISKSHLIRLFKKETNHPPIHFINRTRIARSLYILMRHNDSISSIAKRLGFKSSYAYISLFKRMTGYTPEHFRYELINNYSAVEHIVAALM